MTSRSTKNKVSIHPTACVHPDAQLGDEVCIGAFALIGPQVSLADGVIIGSHCLLEGRTHVGSQTRIYSGAVVGSPPQDKKHRDDDEVFLQIGENNIIREYVTINPGTKDGGGRTVIGDNNLLMAYSHVAHDCQISNNCVIANAGTLGGHVIMEDFAIIGGLTAVHQFVRMGTFSIVGGCSKVVQDIPPYSMCDGHPARVYNVNSVGLKRAKITPEVIRTLRRAFKILFHSGLTKPNAIARVERECASGPELKRLLVFLKTSHRGICG